MNTNDLPPAAKLAALIEAGRAANPDLGHGRAHLLLGNDACALGFACLAAGASRETLVNFPYLVERILGQTMEPSNENLLWRTAMLNDRGATLAEVCQSLREGALATITA